MGIFLPFGDHLNAEREGKRRKPCRIWADGGSATIRSKSERKNHLKRMAGNPATCGYSDGIPFAHFLSTKKPLTFPTSGRSGGEGVHFSIEWALGGMEPPIFSNGWAPDGPGRFKSFASGRTGRPRRCQGGGSGSSPAHPPVLQAGNRRRCNALPALHLQARRIRQRAGVAPSTHPAHLASSVAVESDSGALIIHRQRPQSPLARCRSPLTKAPRRRFIAIVC